MTDLADDDLREDLTAPDVWDAQDVREEMEARGYFDEEGE